VFYDWDKKDQQDLLFDWKMERQSMPAETDDLAKNFGLEAISISFKRFVLERQFEPH